MPINGIPLKTSFQDLEIHSEALLSGIYVQLSCKLSDMVDTNLLLYSKDGLLHLQTSAHLNNID